MTTKTVVTYTRVSSEMQDGEDKVSIEQQTADITALATRNGWIIAASFSDTERYTKTKSPNKGKRVQPSGEYDDRPGFLDMLDLVKGGLIDAIVCWRDDRIMRHTRVYSAVEDALDEADKVRQGRPAVEVYDATGNKLDRFVLGIKAQIGKEENKRRVERITMGKIGTLKRGLWPGVYHRLGYTTEKAERGNRIILGPESEVNTVKDIFNWYDSGMRTADIRRRLIAEGRAQRGWFSNGGKSRQWGISGIVAILRSKDYVGQTTWDFGDKSPSITIDIPQIISPEQFKRVQKRIDKNRRDAKRNTKGVFLLQKIAVCGGCGGRLGAAAREGFFYKKLADGTIKRYKKQGELAYLYRCLAVKAYPEEPHTKPCVFNGTELDAQFWQYVADRMVTHPELIIEQVRNRQQELKNQGDNLDSDIAKTRRKLALIEQDKMTYTRQLGREMITEAVYDALIAEAKETEADLQEELNNLLILRDDAKKANAAIAYTERLLSNIREKLPEINQTPEELKALPEDRQRWVMLERQKIIRSLCDQVIIYANGNITIMGLIEVKDASLVSNFDSDTLERNKCHGVGTG